VRYFNGEVRLTVDDLPSPGFGMAWGHQRTYSNRLSSNADFGNGYNWLVDQWSHIVEFEDGSVEVLFNPLLAYWFDLVDGHYVARFGAKQTLTQVGDQLVLTFPDGELWTYFGFDDPTAPGQLASATSVGGVVMSLSYNSDGTVAHASRSSGATLEQYTYTYGDSGASAGRLTSVVLTRGGTNVTQASYAYYDGTGTFGNLGDLCTVQTPPNNMLCVRQNLYDGGNPGLDGLLTQTTDFVDTDSGNNRVITHGYDWRDRQTSVAGALSYFILRTFDNLDRVTQLNRMDTSASGAKLTQSTTAFDDIGRVYKTQVYEVISGTASNPQTSNNWYDLSGNLIKSLPAGSSAWVKMIYDGLAA
jgi:hypothetical protein